MNFFNQKGQTVYSKTAEPKTTAKKYYGIGTNKKVLDYEGKTRIEAQSYFEMEFAAQGSELEYVGVYNR